MATTLTRTEPAVDLVLHSWTLVNGEAGAAQEELSSGDRCFQVTGTFGTGGTVIIEGSVDGTNWFQLRDPSSTLLSFTAAGLKAVLEAVPYIRPRVTGGDGTTSLVCLISLRRK
jgi:hypothetical protein